jgi:hypothetical protein
LITRDEFAGALKKLGENLDRLSAEFELEAVLAEFA